MTTINNTYIINLDKDKERLKNTLIEYKKISDIPPIRIDGVLGKNATTDQLNKYVNPLYSKYGLKSAIGCALSHVKTWETIIKNNDNSALILEDDVEISNDFKTKIKNINIPEDYFIIYLGCTIGCDIEKKYEIENPIAKLFIGKGYVKKVKKINDNVFIPSMPIALHGYILSKKGAQYLLDNIKKDKIYNHIDAQILKYIYNVPSYSVSPQLIYQKDTSLNNSNNITHPYPIIFNKFLNQTDKYGIPLNYKMNIGVYQVNGYIINCMTFLMLAIGILLGLNKINPTTISIGFVLLSFLEFMEKDPTFNYKQFIYNSSISYILILTSYYIILYTIS